SWPPRLSPPGVLGGWTARPPEAGRVLPVDDEDGSVSTLTWIVVAGVAMSALALSGSLTLVLPERLFNQVVHPLVALAAGTLVGGALFHMVPESVAALGNALSVYGWLAAGMLTFLVLEQVLHWHHCHRPVGARHRPVGYLILA